MDIEDVPFVRVLTMLFGGLRTLLLFGSIFVFPLFFLHDLDRLILAKYLNERRYYQFRLITWACCSNMIFMLMLTFFHNLFGGFGISPFDGEWIFITKLFSSTTGEAAFWNEWKLMLVVAGVCYGIACLIGTTTSSKEFIPRFYKRTH